mmetsp:Transcript_29753/g.53320  ORF Transcript_29753/g.53320 Transcript_29753/m.53320 type:complete len:685 (-) Transcript_29753:310-2364(-)
MIPNGNSFLFGNAPSGEILNMLQLGQQTSVTDALRSSLKANPNIDPTTLASLLQNTQLNRDLVTTNPPSSMPAPLMLTPSMIPTPTMGMGPGSMGPPPAVPQGAMFQNQAIRALADHDPMKRNRSSGLTNMMVVPDGKAQRTRSGQQGYGPMGVQTRGAASPAGPGPSSHPLPPATPEPEVTPEVKSHTARSLLRMLRAGTGMRTKNDISITEAEKLVRKLGGEYAPVEILKTKKRNAGREALSVLLTMYLQKPISIAQAARCFHNPTNRGLEPTNTLWEFLGDRCWPPFPEDKAAKPPSPHPAAVANAVAAQRVQQANAVAAHQASAFAAARAQQARMGYGGGPQAVMQQQQQQTSVTGPDTTSPFAVAVTGAPGMMGNQRPTQMTGTPNMPPLMPGYANGGIGSTMLQMAPSTAPAYQLNYVGSLSQPSPTSAGLPVPVTAGQQFSPMMGALPHNGFLNSSQPRGVANGSGSVSSVPTMPQQGSGSTQEDSSNGWSQGPFSAYAESTGRVPAHNNMRNIPVKTTDGGVATGPSETGPFDVSLSSLLSGGTLQQLSMAVNNLQSKGGGQPEEEPQRQQQEEGVCDGNGGSGAVGNGSSQQETPQANASPTLSGMFNDLIGGENDLSRETTLSGILGTSAVATEPTLQQLATAAKNSKGSAGSGPNPPTLSSELDFENWPELRS